MGTKKKNRNERSREDRRSTQNGAGRNSAKTRPDFQWPEARQAEEKKKDRKGSHSGHGAGAPGVPDAPEGGAHVKTRRKHTKPRDQKQGAGSNNGRTELASRSRSKTRA